MARINDAAIVGIAACIRAVLYAVFPQSMSIAEIARATGLPHAQVRNNMPRVKHLARSGSARRYRYAIDGMSVDRVRVELEQPTPVVRGDYYGGLQREVTSNPLARCSEVTHACADAIKRLMRSSDQLFQTLARSTQLRHQLQQSLVTLQATRDLLTVRDR